MVPTACIVLTTLVLCSEQAKDYCISGKYNTDHTMCGEQDKDYSTPDRYNTDHSSCGERTTGTAPLAGIIQTTTTTTSKTVYSFCI